MHASQIKRIVHMWSLELSDVQRVQVWLASTTDQQMGNHVQPASIYKARLLLWDPLRLLLAISAIIVISSVICINIYHSMLVDKILLATNSSLASAALGSTRMFRSVCLGGTFDGIHAGHKLLFSEATRLTQERLVVGVTDGPMLRGKILWELITPVDERITKVREFLQKMNPNLQYQVVPITDLYGPTITDRELECIVVSEETTRGAEKINRARSDKQWPELKIHVVNLLQEKNVSQQEILSRIGESKISSSSLRVQKLGTIFRPPKPNKSIPARPYLIGLTGGVASGKTSIGKYLETLGFGYINYDLMGHKTYEQVGSPVYQEIIDYFGEEILDKQTRQIDRSQLGKLVFADRLKLDKLNSIVWPAIYRLVDLEIERIKHKHEVIVLESALLLESKQDSRVHQVWTTIVPTEEAIARQMQSRGLSREEAQRRVGAQIDNMTRVQKSNAVFCSLWEPEFTQHQVRKCIQELREKYLSSSSVG